MDDTQITTVSQLDAALAAQRVNRRQKLQRRMLFTKRFSWAQALLGVSALIFLVAYIEDREISSLFGAGVMVVNAIFGHFQMKAMRQEAERALHEEFPEA